MWDYIFGAIILGLIIIAFLSARKEKDDEIDEKCDDTEL